MRITRDSKFIDGVNYQLHYGFDFGEHRLIPGLGLHCMGRIELVRKDFALLAASGIHAVRMNVFTDGRTGILFDETGRALGIQDIVPEGVLNLLRVAEEQNIIVSLVMLDHKFAERAEWVDSTKPELGTKQGHGRLLLTDAGREGLFSNVLKPLLHAIAVAHPANLLSFELVNEPESLIKAISTDIFMPAYLSSAGFIDFKRYMRAFRDAAREETGAQFTVGSLALQHAGRWLDVLDPVEDFLSIHYYGQNNDPPFEKLYAQHPLRGPRRTVQGLQRVIPVVWGEYAANGSSEFFNREFPQSFSRASQFLEDALNHGVKGAYAWALRSGFGNWGDVFGPVPLEEHRLFTARNAHRIEFAGALPPGTTVSV